MPAGASGNQPQAIVQDPDPGYVEFMYLDSSNGLDVDIDAFSIFLVEFPVGTPNFLNSWEIDLLGFDTPISGYSLVSSNFGDSLTISNTVDSFNFVFDGSIGNVVDGLQAELSVRVGDPVPEPV